MEIEWRFVGHQQEYFLYHFITMLVTFLPTGHADKEINKMGRLGQTLQMRKSSNSSRLKLPANIILRRMTEAKLL
jgi:hypothetical protein